MGWIKVDLPDAYHDRLRAEVEQSDKPTHDLAAHYMMEYMDSEKIQLEE